MCFVGADAAAGAASGAAAGLEGLQAIAIGMSVMGTIAQAQAARSSASAQAAQYQHEAEMQKRNAAIAARQAEDAGQRGFVEESELRRKAAALKGTQRAGMAAGGLDVNLGTPLDVLADTAYLSETDAATTRYNAQQERFGYESQYGDLLGKASGSRAAAANARSAGSLASTATILGGVGSVANQWYKYKTGTG